MSGQWDQMECGYVKSPARCRMVQKKVGIIWCGIWEDMGSDIGLKELVRFLK